MAEKLWGGRFAKDTDRLVERFTASIDFDRRLYRQDIAGSTAHCRMLARQGIITAGEAELIVAALAEIEDEFGRGQFTFDPRHEDIHMHIEARLHEKIGELAGKLHTARSRNDQVALDMRLYARELAVVTAARAAGLQQVLLAVAEKHQAVSLPGYTHLQRAQPVLLAHHLLAYFEMLQRDGDRLHRCYERASVMPLGSGALAGVPYPIDRAGVAAELGFLALSRNSIDAVADRDFVVDFLAAAALIAMHLSRLAEEVVLWSSAEFGFLELDDGYATGSSIMPQKKNPDVAELVRGKTGRVYGHLVAVLTMLKGLPLAYNRDLQEDKEALFDAADTVLACLEICAPLLQSATFHGERMAAAVEASFTIATDYADYLVAKGLPFREAHVTVGRLVRQCLLDGRRLGDLTLAEFQRFSPLFGADVAQISVAQSLSARDCFGGTAPARVREALGLAHELLAENLAWVEQRQGL